MPAYKKEALTNEQWNLVASIDETLWIWARKWTPKSLLKNKVDIHETYDILLYMAAKAALRFDQSKGFKFTTYVKEAHAFERVCNFWRRLKDFVSLEDDAAHPDSTSRRDMVPSPEADPESQMMYDCQSALRYLSDRERMIVEHWYGLNGRDRLSRDKLGAMSGLSGTRIWQIHGEALKKIKSRITK